MAEAINWRTNSSWVTSPLKKMTSLPQSRALPVDPHGPIPVHSEVLMVLSRKDLMQVTIDALSSWVQWLGHIHKMTFCCLCSRPLALTFFLPSSVVFSEPLWCYLSYLGLSTSLSLILGTSTTYESLSWLLPKAVRSFSDHGWELLSSTDINMSTGLAV